MEVSIIGQTNHRNIYTPFGIKQADRLHHMYIIGKTGVGKSTLIKNLVMQDIYAGRGCCLFDPHGDMVDEVAQLIPDEHKHRLVYFNVPDPNLEWGYNPLAYVDEERRPLLASGILEIFKKLWPNEFRVRMEHIFRNTILTLLEQPNGANLSDVLKLYTDDNYRQKCLRNVKNKMVLDYWHKEFAKYHYRMKSEATVPILNKLGGFLSNPTLYRVLCNSKKEMRLRTVMDDKKILLINLAKGQIGEDAANLLGSLMLTSLGLAAYSRSDMPENQRIPFHVFVDECHNFTTMSTASMMSEMRKYACSLTFANQYLFQFDKDVREAVLGNAGTLICFRVGPKDAVCVAREFNGIFNQQDLMDLPNYNMYLKLMIDGIPGRGFSGNTVITSATKGHALD